MDELQRAKEHFDSIGIADFEMAVKHDDGMHRHLFFRGESLQYHYHLVTWPGYLAIDGDIQSGYIFSRTADMFRFFAPGPGPDINPHYWAEKITNHDARRARQYSERAFHVASEQALTNFAESEELEVGPLRNLWAAHLRVEMADTSTESTARAAAESFRYMGRGFTDVWEWDLTDWDHSYLLCCHAIRAGIATYMKEKHE